MTTTKKQELKVEKADGILGHVWYDEAGGAAVPIVSVMPYPFIIPVTRKVGEVEVTLGTIKMMPGQNMVSEDDWNAVRDMPQVKKRLEENWIQPGVLGKQHKYELTETNKTKFIEEHCAKATSSKFSTDMVTGNVSISQLVR